MTIDRRLVAGAVGLAIMLAACGGAAGPSATGAAPTEAAPTEAAPTEAVPTEAAPTEAAATDEPTDDGNGGVGGLPGGMNDLANLLPEEAAGTTFQRAGFTGEQLGLYGAAAGLSESQLADVLEQFGKSMSDVNMAFAAPIGGTTTGSILAMQIEGVPAADWMAEAGMAASGMNELTLGGKTVYSQGTGAFSIWLYPTGDTVFMVILGDQALAESIFSQLP